MEPRIPASQSEPEAAHQLLERSLRELLEPHLAALSVPSEPRLGAPPVLPMMLLWVGMLVGALHRYTCQADIWRLVSIHGLWGMDPVPVTDMAVYNRLARTGPVVVAGLFRQVTNLLKVRLPPRSACHLASFAPEVYACDHTTLAAVSRKRGLFRNLDKGDLQLIPGALVCVFDIRRQLWEGVSYCDQTQDARVDLDPLLQPLTRGSLLLFDLGYFSFKWLDSLHDAGFWYVTRLLKRATYVVQHTLCDWSGPNLKVRDQLVYLGTYRANKAAVPVRLIEIQVGERTFRYITNVVDPVQLPVWQVAELYRRRWDIEKAFDFVKTELKLQLLWSGHLNVVLQQVFASLIIAQVALGLRNEIASAADCDPREVSLPLLLKWLPRLARMGRDPLAEFVATGRRAGYIRPFRGKDWELPELGPDDYELPPEPIPRRPSRYPSREYYFRQKAERATQPKPPSTYRPYGNKAKRNK